METATYQPDDFHRIFLGEVPPVFFIEVIIRTILVFIILIAAIRLMGKRMALQLTANEMVAMVALAAAIGIPLQAPDRGILPAVVIALIVVAVQRLIAKYMVKNQVFEKVSQGDLAILIEDGIINHAAIRHSAVTPERLFEQVRGHGIAQLGQVKRLYLETSGAFTLLENENPPAGLSVIPDYDDNYWEETEFDTERYACKNCGYTEIQLPVSALCAHCGKQEWTRAVCT